MSATTQVVLVVGAGTVLLKGAGPLLLGGRRLPLRLQGVVVLLAPTLLASLIVVQAFASGRELAVDARAGGLAAAGVCVALRAPVLLSVGAAAATAAALRALSG
jgi:hypothetical protein